MAEVFLATAPGEHGFQKKVVIKRLLPHLVYDGNYNAMFIDEAKLTARLVHPKIAQTFELGKVEDSLFIAMEFVDGIDVLALLREFASKKRRVDPHLAAWVAHEVLDALDYAHNAASEDGKTLGIVHRDISPSNVLLSLRGDIKLVDFGIARASGPERAHKSKSGTLKGKYGYMSPEQVLEQPLDARSDLFSVGVVLAELLTGRRLFAAANELDVLLMVRDAKLTRLDKYGGDLEPGLNEIVRKALKKPLEERWHSAAAFRDALSEWLFEHRHRMTPKHVAEVVASLRDAVIERRRRAISIPAATAAPAERESVDDLEIPREINRAMSESDVPVMIIDGGPGELSMPVITYEGVPPEDKLVDKLQRAVDAVQAIPPEPSNSTRLPTVPSRPRTNVGIGPEPPVRASQPRFGFDAARAPRSEILPASETSGSVDISMDLELGASGIPDLPMAESISAAIETITMRDDITPPPRITEDSGLRSFDDLTSESGRVSQRSMKRELPPIPSAADLARKRPPTPPALADISEPPDDAGDFSLISPLRVLFRLMTARATGLLVVFVGGIKKEIYVRDGQPEYVSSNVASELFGNYLVSKGVLSDGELAMALAMMPHYGGKLGDTLVGLGLLKPLEVFRHLTRQVRTKIIDVCTWNKGQFGWYAGRENPREAFPLDFNAFEILGAGAMAVADDVIESWIAKNGSLRLRVARARRVGPERFEVKGLVEMCDQLDGRRSIGDFVEMQSDRNERLRAGRMLNLLEACDLARPA